MTNWATNGFTFALSLSWMSASAAGELVVHLQHGGVVSDAMGAHLLARRMTPLAQAIGSSTPKEDGFWREIVPPERRS